MTVGQIHVLVQPASVRVDVRVDAFSRDEALSTVRIVEELASNATAATEVFSLSISIVQRPVVQATVEEAARESVTQASPSTSSPTPPSQAGSDGTYVLWAGGGALIIAAVIAALRMWCSCGKKPSRQHQCHGTTLFKQHCEQGKGEGSSTSTEVKSPDGNDTSPPSATVPVDNPTIRHFIDARSATVPRHMPQTAAGRKVRCKGHPSAVSPLPIRDSPVTE